MDINIRLGGGGGSNGRQAKLSAKHTSNNATQTIQQAGHSNAKTSHKMSGGGGGAVGTGVGIASGKVGSMMGVASKVPAMAAVYLALGSLDKIIQFGANVYRGISGEDMLASNIKAQSKTVATLGLNLVAGSINNAIFVEPRIRRENDMKDYGRELYFNASEKNKLT